MLDKHADSPAPTGLNKNSGFSELYRPEIH